MRRLLCILGAVVVAMSPGTASGNCWTLVPEYEGSEIRLQVRVPPNVADSGLVGYVVYSKVLGVCGPDLGHRITPHPIPFGLTGLAIEPQSSETSSYKYSLVGIDSEGQESSIWSVCELAEGTLGFVPPIWWYSPSGLIYLGRGKLAGPAGTYGQRSLVTCDNTCSPACDGLRAGGVSQAELDLLAERSQTADFWGRIDHGGDYCFTWVDQAIPAICTVSAAHHSWGALKGRY